MGFHAGNDRLDFSGAVPISVKAACFSGNIDD